MWRIFAGLCIRRPAVVSPPLSPIQRQVQDFYERLEIQESHLSSHEVRHRNDVERMAQVAKEQESARKRSSTTSSYQSTSEDSVASLLTAKDMELSWEANEREFWNDISKLGSYFLKNDL